MPGVGVAIVRDGDVTAGAAGVRSVSEPARVDASTVFDAASLTKPLIAYVAMQLVDAGSLALDARVARYAPAAMADDIDAAPITVGHLLAHRSGLPNLLDGSDAILHFRPGERFSYSSAGYAYLQRAIEAITGEPIEATTRRLVFEPLRMRDSSLIWQRRFEANHARPHENGVPLDKHRPPFAAASYSLQTTAADYARFVAATIAGSALAATTHREWLEPCVAVPAGRAVDLADAAPTHEPGLAWALGWGIETGSGSFFQWGKIHGIRTFAMGCPGIRSGVVLLANGNTGLRALDEIVGDHLPGDHPALGWLRACVSE